MLSFLLGTLAILTSEVPGLVKVAEAGLLMVVAVGGYLVLKRLVIQQATVEVWAERVVVHYHSRSQPSVIEFAEVKHYKHKSLRDREEIVFRLANKASRKISANQLFGSIGDFAGLVQALETVAGRYQQLHPGSMVRARSFFERRISTVLLIVITFLLLLFVSKSLFNASVPTVNILGAAGAYLSYLGSWWTAGKGRSQHEA
ncbi:hypothetical protein [Hymenobacter rigui]|uniref:Uncharacterized protein n=1 Tax=Hymenobacter rigui TaxID=334424 RepID=A0A3R9MLJ3_9BACT|nr:hypothetical protein [Hymenobacter rigui]RSK45075.1 hypothetical protein EI291_19755 [Hymenobacter rigui]